MMSSRGMGAVNPSKMPKAKTIKRKDDPNKVAMYKRGGKVKCMDEGGPTVKPTDVTLDKDYKRVGTQFSSGDIPIGESGKASFSANTSVSAAKGERAKAMVDNLQADYKHQLNKDTSIGASLSHAPKGDSRVTFALNKRFAKGGSAKQAATAIAMKAAGKKPKKMADGGELKEVPEDNAGLSKLPTEVRNKMGYMKEGGKAKSKVNEAGNYTKPDLRKRIFNSVKAAAIVGTGAGQWSARKAQVMAKRYKAAGGGYRD